MLQTIKNALQVALGYIIQIPAHVEQQVQAAEDHIKAVWDDVIAFIEAEKTKAENEATLFKQAFTQAMAVLKNGSTNTAESVAAQQVASTPADNHQQPSDPNATPSANVDGTNS